MRNFIKIKKVRNLYMVIFSCLFFVVIDLFFYHNVTDQILSVAKAYEVIRFGQVIMPIDPVEKSNDASKEESNGAGLADSEYRFVARLADANNENPKIEKEDTAYGSIINFKGQSIYPNSIVYLEINSDKIITSAMSDGNGDWSWTNYAEPLENGEHTLEMYNISPYDISGKRDIYIEKYAFIVKSTANSSNFPQSFSLSGLEVPHSGARVAGSFESKLTGESTNSAYIFQLIFPMKKTFDPGETMKIQLLFEALKKEQAKEAKIKYEIFKHIDDNFSTEKTSEFKDEIVLGEENSFAKFIKLKSDMVSGDYILKATVLIDGDRYIQTQRFSISEKEVIKIGSLSVTQEKLTIVMVWNIFLILLIIIILTMMIALEYRRFIRCVPIDEDFLKRKGFFK